MTPTQPLVPPRDATFGATAVVVVVLLARFGPGMEDPLGTGEPSAVRAVGYSLLGLSWLGVAVVERLRGHRRSSSLLMSVALVVALGTLIVTRVPFAFTVGSMVTTAGMTLLAYLLAVYPDGRLHDWRDKAPVLLAGLGTLSTVPVHLFWAPDVSGCGTCPPGLNVLLWQQSTPALAVALAAGGVAVVAALAGVAFTAVRRQRAAGPVARRVLLPVNASALVFVASTVLFLVGQNTELPELSPLHANSGLGGAGFLVAATALPVALLLARARERDLGQRMREVGVPLDGTGLEDALRVLTADPLLQVGYAGPGGAYVTAEGHDVVLPPADDAARTVTSLGPEIGLLVHDAALLREPLLWNPVVVIAALAVRNQLLAREVSARLDEVRAARRRLVQASDAARRRVERDLHDGAQQRLVTLAIGLQALRLRDDAAPLERDLTDATTELERALLELRELARGVYPQLLDHGLGPALASLAAEAPTSASVDVDVAAALPTDVEVAAYFVVAEALTNVAKHARTAARVAVCAEQGWLEVTVADDGPGGADADGGGLTGLADRVAALGGELLVESPRGVGTVLRARLPLPVAGAQDETHDVQPAHVTA